MKDRPLTQTVTVPLGDRTYDIVIGTGILHLAGEHVRAFRFSGKVAVVSNPTVFSLYGETISTSLRDAGHDPFPLLIPEGEEYKDYFWTYHLLTELLTERLDRNSCIVALGGGVIGDITGFVASVYMRGIPFIQVPTTLLAQVDSSVGGKTGVNHALGKNMIGTFHQPRLVWIDCLTLRTLPRRELLCGIAEVIKYGVMWDEALFHFLDQNRDSILSGDPESLSWIIRRSCEIKAEVVSKDERESGLRAILNYGHTIGHALETETGYTTFLHGEAIAIGMCLEAELSAQLGFLQRDGVAEIAQMIESYGLPTMLPRSVDLERLLAHMALDKKAVEGELKVILPQKVGKAAIHPGVSLDMIRRALTS